MQSLQKSGLWLGVGGANPPTNVTANKLINNTVKKKMASLVPLPLAPSVPAGRWSGIGDLELTGDHGGPMMNRVALLPD